jgi:hypothetical protein
MRAAMGVLLAGVLLAAAAAANPLPTPHSWSKLGITFTEYRKDAFECTYTSFLDVRATVTKKPRMNEIPILNYGPNGGIDYDAALTGFLSQYQHEQIMRTKEADDLLQAAIDSCLRKRGYRPFRLTDAQEQALRALAKGSQPRHEYLYSLAVDPAVLSQQGL